MKDAWHNVRLAWKWRQLIVTELRLGLLKVWLAVLKAELAEARSDQLLQRVMRR